MVRLMGEKKYEQERDDSSNEQWRALLAQFPSNLEAFHTRGTALFQPEQKPRQFNSNP